MRTRTVNLWLLLVGITSMACSSAQESANNQGSAPAVPSTDEGRVTSEAQGSASAHSPTPSATEDPFDVLPDNAPAPTDGGSPACASATAAGELQQLALAFAFDVSGSMGKGDKPYHDKQLKWDPVVEASKGFFASTDIARVSASLVFFPAEDDGCDEETYTEPSVELTTLPSAAFGEAIDDVTPESEDDWRGGTPTLAVVQATINYVRSLREAGSKARHAIVLVTDGTPQDCEEEADRIEAVAEVVASVSTEIPVYVIGVANPITEEEPEPPDNVSNLHQIAQSGGTTSAFLVDTGNPAQTVTSFNEAIAKIRSQGLSCEIDIPAAPSGKTFDKEAVNVSLTTSTIETALGYSADCSDTGAWRFDDPETPAKIVLCEDTCELTKSAADPSLQVEFGCERRSAAVR